MKELGEPRNLSLSEVFTGEATEFTPWLSQNLDALAVQLGIELEHDDTEVSVGAFKADIKARTTDNKSVVIENQFGTTDHSHLGQLLTYAAGLEADIVIWVSERIRDEHRAAVDWLNSRTTDADFFAVEARPVQIDESRPALFWDVVSSPNDWSRTSKRTQSVEKGSDLDALRISYWATLNNTIDERGIDLFKFKPDTASWQGGTIGKSNFFLFSVIGVRDKWLRVEIYLDGEYSQQWFDGLWDRKEETESELGYKLDWDPLEGKRACRISTTTDADPVDKSDWPRQHDWIIKKRIEFGRVFRPLVQLVI